VQAGLSSINGKNRSVERSRCDFIEIFLGKQANFVAKEQF
jgi:hypothetical protein